MPRLPLTDEQKTASCFDNRRLFIEAAPGSGKTTVAAERFGVLRFARRTTAPGAITALSFTRSATGELHRRIRSRWGSSALNWPHRVMTIDALLCEILQHLLRTGILRWPGDHTSLQVLDDWRGHRGYRWLTAGNYRRLATIHNGIVTSVGDLVNVARMGIGSRDDFHRNLADGRCTHDEVRQVVAESLRVPEMNQAIVKFISTSISHLVVDEVFDANNLDLELVILACNADIDVTLVGDPWQALYGFRGARPELVPALIEEGDFNALPLTQSFRFKTQFMKQLGDDLRSGRAVTLGNAAEYDVVLASRWDDLWTAPSDVLPLSFGRTTNKTDAAAIVLLDHLVYAAFSQHAIFLQEALVLLDLDPEEYRTHGPTVLGGVVEALSQTDATAAATALALLRQAVKELGASRRPPTGRGDSDQRQLDRLAALALRIRSGGQLVPGMTIHQAKGREWDFVGVRLSSSELASLASGLDQSREQDRAVYVALTRARHGVGLLP